MDIAKLIEDHVMLRTPDSEEKVISVGDLKELLKTHSIVPKEPTEAMLDVVRRDYDGPGYCFTETYKAMIKASQENS